MLGSQTADHIRLDTDKVEFKFPVGEFEKNWPQIAERAQIGA
jgi:hypothetical protein